MSMNFQRGDLVNAAWQATGGAQIVLNIKGHTLDLSCLLYVVTNTGTLGQAARLAGTQDIDGKIDTSFDLDNPFYGPPSMRPGQAGIASFGVNAAQTRFIQCPVSIEKTGLATAVEQELRQSISVKGNELAGFFVYPPLGSP